MMKYTGAWAKRVTSPKQHPTTPRLPYSASKAGSDHLVMAYHHTWTIPYGCSMSVPASTGRGLKRIIMIVQFLGVNKFNAFLFFLLQ